MGDRRVGARLAVPDAGSLKTTVWERPSGHSEATPQHTLKTDESEFLKHISTLLRARWKPLAPKKILMIDAPLRPRPDGALWTKINFRHDQVCAPVDARAPRLGDAVR
jgi:hypothetical protein